MKMYNFYSYRNKTNLLLLGTTLYKGGKECNGFTVFIIINFVYALVCLKSFIRFLIHTRSINSI